MADLIDRSELRKDFCNMCEAMQPEMIDCEKKGCMSMQIIDEQPAVNRWIPCETAMPEVGMPVLIYGCSHRVTAYYDNCKNLFRLTEDDNLYYIAEYVTHWMPLPEPPEQDDDSP
jgi:hypothetical protein